MAPEETVGFFVRKSDVNQSKECPSEISQGISTHMVLTILMVWLRAVVLPSHSKSSYPCAFIGMSEVFTT